MHCLTRPVHPQRACCSSGLDEGWSESSHDYANKPAVGLRRFEGALWLVAPQPQLVIRRRLGALPIVKRQPQCYPMGWTDALGVLEHTVAQRCSNEAGPSCAAEPALLLQVPQFGLPLAGYWFPLRGC